jgi:hypothetical protein
MNLNKISNMIKPNTTFSDTFCTEDNKEKYENWLLSISRVIVKNMDENTLNFFIPEIFNVNSNICTTTVVSNSNGTKKKFVLSNNKMENPTGIHVNTIDDKIENKSYKYFSIKLPPNIIDIVMNMKNMTNE